MRTSHTPNDDQIETSRGIRLDYGDVRDVVYGIFLRNEQKPTFDRFGEGRVSPLMDANEGREAVFPTNLTNFHEWK